MKTVVCSPEGTLTVALQALPRPGPGEVLVKVLACGVCGTDVRKVLGGALTRPAVLGHEVVGEVVESRAPERFRVGERLATSHHVPCFQCHFCRHDNFSMCPQFKASALDPGGFSQYLRLSAPHVESLAHRLPEGMALEDAVFMEPVACCLKALRRCRLRMGDTALIVGLGSVGLLFGLLLKRLGIAAVGLDADDGRAKSGVDYGYAETFARWGPEAKTAAEKLSEHRGVDAVIVNAGTSPLLLSLIESLREGGTLCLFGGAEGDAVVPLPWNTIYHRELVVTASYSPSPEDLREAFRLIAEGLFVPRRLPVRLYRLEETAQAVADLKDRRVLKAVVTP